MISYQLQSDSQDAEALPMSENWPFSTSDHHLEKFPAISEKW